jgi:ribosomal protein L7Ae-like RNA K-turn-binding protein
MLGLKEVQKHLNADNLTMVILATNLEKVEEAKGTDEIVTNIAITCRAKKIPLVFAMNRFKLGCVSKFKG